jgi:hypothetical protein
MRAQIVSLGLAIERLNDRVAKLEHNKGAERERKYEALKALFEDAPTDAPVERVRNAVKELVADSPIAATNAGEPD